MKEKIWMAGDSESCDACVLCMDGQKSPSGDDRHNRIAAASDQPIEWMAKCSTCACCGKTGQIMPDSDPARQWMDEQAE